MPFSFFLEFDATQGFTKRDVDNCNVNPSWASTCDAIRAVFFLSRSIRKERDAWLSFPGIGMLLTMTGRSLRYLGPDERSMLMLVDKAMIAVGTRTRTENDPSSQVGWIESTPGVRCRTIAGQEEALHAFTSAHEGCTFFFPDFTTSEGDATTGFTFPEELPAIAAASRACVVLGNDGENAFPTWLASDDQESPREHPIKFIKAPIHTRTKLETLASKIMLFNLIDDNFCIDKREP